MSDDWRAWVTGSEAALRVGRGVRALAGCGLAVAAALVLGTLAVGRPIGSTGAFLIPTVLVVFAGQLWGVAVLTARGANDDHRRNRASRWGRGSLGAPRRFFFEGLPVRRANALLALAFLGLLAGMTAFPSLTSGGPTSPMPGCRYPLNNHGSYTCVSRATYARAGAAEQRLFAGILGAFFAVQFGIAAAELARRRAVSTQAVG